MITLITGTPGSGKTAYAVWMMMRESKKGRRLVVDGVRDLALDHVLVDEPWVRQWPSNVVANDLVIIDEVQRYWPPVSVSVKATPDIEALHTHRHMGVDFVLITQHPNRLNKTIRDLVGRHVHVRRLFGLRETILYEWDSARNPNAGFRDAVKSRWRYPRSVLHSYTSAELHTKQKAVIPKTLFVLPLLLLVGGFFAWRSYHDVKGKQSASGSAVASGVSAGHPVGASGGEASDKWRVAGEYAVGGRAFVLLADAHGRFRSELVGGFNADGGGIEGMVDGKRVASWSGGGAIDAGAHK